MLNICTAIGAALPLDEVTDEDDREDMVEEALTKLCEAVVEAAEGYADNVVGRPSNG